MINNECRIKYTSACDLNSKFNQPLNNCFYEYTAFIIVPNINTKTLCSQTCSAS